MNLNEYLSAQVMPQPRTLIEVSQWRAHHQADQRLYVFLTDDRDEQITLTYADLDRRAKAVAAQLQSFQTKNTRALILYPPGADYTIAFWGCLYAGLTAVPAYPPHLNRSLTRLTSIIEDAQPEVVLTDTRTLADVQRRGTQAEALKLSRWIATDTIAIDRAEQWIDPQITEDTLAFLQYSSGSTSAPKGVMVSHKNVLYNVAHLSELSHSSAHSVGVTWLPPYHDLGLIGAIIQSLIIGFPLIYMSPFSFLQRPVRWLQAVSKYRGTHCAAPDFAYALCAKKITAEERSSLDLSSWEFASCGAEPVHAETLELFTDSFASSGFKREAFYPCYGLAEATLIVSGRHLQTGHLNVKNFATNELLQNHVVPALASDSDAKTLVGCGPTLPEQKLLIVDPQTCQPCAADQVGEIWISGPSIAQGYWNKPEQSQETFNAFLAGSEQGPFLRTGDAGFLCDDELFITGRLKDLIIIHGNNYYPQDIEATVEKSHPSLRPNCTAAFSIDGANEEQLVIVQEIDRQYRELDVESVCLAMREAVLDQHDLFVSAIVLIKHGSILKTSSGKIQRYMCRNDFIEHRLNSLGESIYSEEQADEEHDFVAPSTPLEHQLAEVWMEILGIDEVGITDNFFTLGGHSLQATQLLSRLRDIFQREVPLRFLFEDATISGIIDGMDAIANGAQVDEVPDIVFLERAGYSSSNP